MTTDIQRIVFSDSMKLADLVDVNFKLLNVLSRLGISLGFGEKVCPECGSSNIKDYGLGTEKLEEELNKIFDARIVRMDMDTTSRKGMHEKIINDFVQNDEVAK